MKAIIYAFIFFNLSTETFGKACDHHQPKNWPSWLFKWFFGKYESHEYDDYDYEDDYDYDTDIYEDYYYYEDYDGHDAAIDFRDEGQLCEGTLKIYHENHHHTFS